MHSLRRRAIALAATTLLWGAGLAAQTPADSVARRQQRTLDSLAAVVRALQSRLDSLARARSDSSVGDDLAALRAAAAAAGDSGAAASAAPSQARLGLNALNPEISVTAIVHGSVLRPGPQTESFDAREFEFSFQSALDPYSYTKIFASVTREGIDIEEGYAYWSGLPGHLRLDVGKFRQPVGELNRWHRHALPEGELPLVHQLYLGGTEGLAGTGVSLYWPLPFSGRAGAYELTTQVTRGTNPTLFAAGDRPSYLSQLSGFWQFSRSTYGQLSATGLYGTNPDSSLETTLGVLAARFSWRPPAQAKYRELTVRGELFALRRRFDGVGPARLGGYIGGQWRLNRRWIVGARGDYVESPDPLVASHQWETHATLTFWQSEFVYLRAQWTHRRDAAALDSERLALHAVWAMGPHKHELF
jgi:hypothetical protein